MTEKDKGKKKRQRGSGLSLHPLSIQDALRGAMATGKPPEPVPHNKHAKRTATKRRLTKGERSSKAGEES